jgi:O-antigen ligase
MKKAFYFSIYLLFFATPFESVGIIPGFSVVKLVTLFFIFFSLHRYFTSPIKVYPFIRYIFYYIFFAMISVAWSIGIETTLFSSYGTLFPTLIVTVFLFNGIDKKEQIVNIFKSYSIGSVIISLYALYLYFTEFRFLQYGNARVTVLGQDQNELSFLLTFGIICLLYLFQFEKISRKLKLIMLSCIFLMIFVILTTGSRTGFIILLFTGLVFAVINFKGSKIFVLIPIVTGLSIYLFLNLPEVIYSRLIETSSQIESGDFTNRERIWEMGFNAFIDSGRLLFGTGHDTFRILMNNSYGWLTAGHNTYLITLIELGLIGFILYMRILLYLARKVWILIRRDSLFFSLLLVPLLISMLTLGLQNRRWLFIIGVIIIKLVEFGSSRNKLTIK